MRIPVAMALLLEGKRGLIVGIANEKNPLAWRCAKASRAFGAELAVTYRNAKVKTFVEPLARGSYCDAAPLITGEMLYIDGGYYIID